MSEKQPPLPIGTTAIAVRRIASVFLIGIGLIFFALPLYSMIVAVERGVGVVGGLRAEMQCCLAYAILCFSSAWFVRRRLP